MLFIIIGLIVLFAAIGILVITIYNKFQLAFIKIDEAENNIDLLLEKKLDLLTRMASLIENDLKEEDSGFLDIKKLKSKKLNHFQMRDALDKKTKELNEIFDIKPNFYEFDSVTSLLEEFVDINTDLDAAIKYYNDNVVLYNQLIRLFPSNLLGAIFRYKIKEFYNDEKEEIFEILKK